MKVAPQILKAIGVQYEIIENNGHTTVSFEYNHKAYKIVCNTVAAEFSNDYLQSGTVLLNDLFALTDLAGMDRKEVEEVILKDFDCTMVDNKIISFNLDSDSNKKVTYKNSSNELYYYSSTTEGLVGDLLRQIKSNAHQGNYTSKDIGLYHLQLLETEEFMKLKEANRVSDVNAELDTKYGVIYPYGEDHRVYRVGDGNDHLYGGSADTIWYYLTGVKPVSTNLMFEERRDMFLKYLANGGIATTTIGQSHIVDALVEYEDGRKEYGTFFHSGGLHSLAIVAADENTITIVNPWDSSTKYTIKWEDFIEMYRAGDENTAKLMSQSSTFVAINFHYLPPLGNDSAYMEPSVYESEKQNIEIYLQLFGYDNASYEDYLKYTNQKDDIQLRFLFDGVYQHIDFNQEI